MMHAVGTLGFPPGVTHGGPLLHASLDSEVAIVAIVMGSLATVAYPLARALASRLTARTEGTDRLSGDTEQRLERMERAIESIAVEVERISEGQRFTTKLLAERAAAPPPRETTEGR